MNILGISAFYHDSAAALVQDGIIVAAAQEERFTRRKHDAAFPANAVSYCFREAGITSADVDAVVFYEKPLLKADRLIETYLGVAPSGLKSFLMAMPTWLRQSYAAQGDTTADAWRERALRAVCAGLISLCNLYVLCVSVVVVLNNSSTTEAQRTQRLHREEETNDEHSFPPIFSTR